MIAACVNFTGPPSLARDVLASADCLIGGQVQSAYAALFAPGGVFVPALTSALTIYVAIIGYRLILGQAGLTLGELVPHFIKIGLVLALITSWPAYQALVFELLFHGPKQLADLIVRHIGGSGSGQGDVLAALQALFDRMTDYAGDAWAQVSEPVAPAAATTAPLVPPALGGTAAAAAAATIPTLPFSLGAPQFVALALWLAALVMLGTTVGVLLVVRIILALLLVLGPLFIALALFAPSRGVFEGWLRVTVKFALVPLFTLPLAAALLAVLIPFVAELGDVPVESFRDGPALSILLIVLVFAAVLMQAARLAGGIAGGIRLPRAAPAAPQAAHTTVIAAVSPGSSTGSVRRTDIAARTIGGVDRTAGADINATAQLVTSRSITTTATAASTESGSRLGQGYRRLAIGTVAPRPVER